MNKETEQFIAIPVEEYEHLKNCERNLQEIIMKQLESARAMINNMAQQQTMTIGDQLNTCKQPCKLDISTQINTGYVLPI